MTTASSILKASTLSSILITFSTSSPVPALTTFVVSAGPLRHYFQFHFLFLLKVVECLFSSDKLACAIASTSTPLAAIILGSIDCIIFFMFLPPKSFSNTIILYTQMATLFIHKWELHEYKMDYKR